MPQCPHFPDQGSFLQAPLALVMIPAGTIPLSVVYFCFDVTVKLG
jgi:hypothetical protein